jgi:hypothetical protein
LCIIIVDQFSLTYRGETVISSADYLRWLNPIGSYTPEDVIEVHQKQHLTSKTVNLHSAFHVIASFPVFHNFKLSSHIAITVSFPNVISDTPYVHLSTTNAPHCREAFAFNYPANTAWQQPRLVNRNVGCKAIAKERIVPQNARGLFSHQHATAFVGNKSIFN